MTLIIVEFFTGRIQLWGHPIAVDWAEPEVEVDEDTMSSVKILYVRNLMLATTEESIEKEFNGIKPGSRKEKACLDRNLLVRNLRKKSLWLKSFSFAGILGKETKQP